MFAGEFATGTTACNRQCGEIDTCLVEGASLALPPESIGILSKVLPVFGIGKLLARGCGTGIGSEGEYLIVTG